MTGTRGPEAALPPPVPGIDSYTRLHRQIFPESDECR